MLTRCAKSEFDRAWLVGLLRLYGAQCSSPEAALAQCGLAGAYFDLGGDFLGTMPEAFSAELKLLHDARVQTIEKDVVDLCAVKGLPYKWMKGWANRSLYSEPHFRLMTDMDLWVPGDIVAIKLARLLVREMGYQIVRQKRPYPLNYEIVLSSPDGLVLEIHTALGPRMLFRQCNPLVPVSDTRLLEFAVHFFQHGGILQPHQLFELPRVLRNTKLAAVSQTFAHTGLLTLLAWLEAWFGLIGKSISGDVYLDLQENFFAKLGLEEFAYKEEVSQWQRHLENEKQEASGKAFARKKKAAAKIIRSRLPLHS